MSRTHIATYLNDHLAGSVVALELLEYLEKADAASEFQQFFREMRTDITADRRELEGLMQQLNVAVSSMRQAIAWLAEKSTQIKLRLDDPADGSLRFLEAVEGVALGVDGKRALWRALNAAAQRAPELSGPDYARLERRADEQRQRLETVRLQAALAALSP